MTLGEKLRQVRTERGLSQKQVAGTYMTRNMLSQLENDQASPSVKTLSYLSDVLQVSMSWLLEDGPRSGSSQITERARNDYLDGNYRACLDSLVGMDQKSEEDQLLMCRSSLAYGLECFENGNFSEAENAAQTALSCHGPYITELDYLQAKHLLCRCALIQSEPADDRIIMFQEEYERYLQNWDPTLLLIWQSLTQKRLDDARRAPGTRYRTLRKQLRTFLSHPSAHSFLRYGTPCIWRARFQSLWMHRIPAHLR